MEYTLIIHCGEFVSSLFMGYLTKLSVSGLHSMADELERIRKEVVVDQLMHYSGIYVSKLRKTTKNLRIAGVQAEI
jgi:hypothetical protein